MSEADRDLVVASRGGDVRAFGRLVERHHGAVTAVAFAVTRDIALSEDVAQDTFVIAWTQLRELRDPAAVRAWLCNIARNKSKNELRGRKREVAVEADAIDHEPSVLDAAIAREAEAQLRASLAELPENYREPLVLFYWEEQSIQNVASALDITEQAAQKRISRARSYVQDDLATRLTDAAHGRRSAKAAAAAIVAVLASRAAPAAAATTASKAGIGAIKLATIAGMVAIVVLVGAAIWSQLASSGAAASPAPKASAPTSTHAKQGVPPSPRPAALPAGGDTTPSDRPSDDLLDPTAATGSFGSPQSYEVTVLSATDVAVNLAGGKSSVYNWQDPPAPTFSRHIRGRVLDENGKPIAGAVVLVGERLPVAFGGLMGDAGGLTTKAGTFDVIAHSEQPLSAMALHAQAGWSLAVAVPSGRADAEIEIRASARGGLSGTVRRGGQPIQSDISVTGDGELRVSLTTDHRGHFEIPLLAPGRYKLTAHATQLIAGGSSNQVEQDLVIEAGKPRVVKLDLPSGVLVVVTVRDATKLSTAEYYLVPGEQTGLDAAKLRDLRRSGKAQAYLLGGQDVDRPMQFHDVSPGPYTLCIERKLDRDTALALICKPLVVAADKPILEVDVGD